MKPRDHNRALAQELQEAYMVTVEAIYQHLADLLMQADRVPEAQQVLDLLKGEESRESRPHAQAGWTSDGIALTPLEQPLADAFGRLIALGQQIYICESNNCPEMELDAYYRDQERLVADYNRQAADFEAAMRNNQ